MSVRLDKDPGPILRVTWDGATTDAEMQAHLRELSAMVASVDRYAMIHDARRSSAPNAKIRQLQAEWMAANDARIRRSCAGVAFVIESAVVRGALTAILWIQPMAVPHLITASLDEARRFCAERLGGGRVSGDARR